MLGLTTSNQNLNYYKFRLGLGVTTSALEKKNVPENKKGEAADAAAGGADQCVVETSTTDPQTHYYRSRSVL